MSDSCILSLFIGVWSKAPTRERGASIIRLIDHIHTYPSCYCFRRYNVISIVTLESIELKSKTCILQCIICVGVWLVCGVHRQKPTYIYMRHVHCEIIVSLELAAAAAAADLNIYTTMSHHCTSCAKRAWGSLTHAHCHSDRPISSLW